MNCNEIKDLLSAYHDGELTLSQQESVEDHLAECPACTADLAAIRHISTMAARLPQPEPPDQWATIQRELTFADPRSPRLSILSRIHTHRVAVAASLALAVGLAAAYFGFNSPAIRNQHLAMNFDSFLGQFDSQPDAAEHVLLTSYNGRQVDIDEATQLIGYQPAIAHGLPPGYAVEAVYVLNMPCCKCPQVICRSDDGRRLAIFEHESDQPVWFGNRPAIDTHCAGRPTRLVEVEADMLAATWPSRQRHLTVVGARDVEEVAQLVTYLESPSDPM